jgi:hypothetical protein
LGGPRRLDSQAGRYLVVLARKIPGNRAKLLAEAQTLLAPRAAGPHAVTYPRSAQRAAGWLALAHSQAKEYDQAITVGRQALERLPAVRSPRSVDLLRELRTELTQPAKKHPTVRAFITELDSQLTA